jgi:hypothetical protein
VNTLALLRRALAFEQGAAVRQTAYRHIHLTGEHVAVAFSVLSGEPFSVLGIAYGTDPDEPAGSIVVPEPRNRDLRFAALGRFADAFCEYIDSYMGFEMVARKPGGKKYTHCTRAPQIVVANTSAAKALTRAVGRGPRGVPEPASLAWCSAHLSLLADQFDRVGQALLIPAATALASAFATGQGGGEDEHLPAMLAWITPQHTGREERLAAISEAEQQAWAELRNPEDDKVLIALVAAYNAAEQEVEKAAVHQEITGRVEENLRDAYHGTRICRPGPSTPNDAAAVALNRRRSAVSQRNRPFGRRARWSRQKRGPRRRWPMTTR